MEYWAAFTLGLLGSLHCVGMCGPIALAIPLTSKDRANVVVQSLLYQFGRITTYSLLGLIMGAMGWGIVLAGYQKLFTITFGVAIIVIALFSISIERKLLQNHFINNGFNWVKRKLAKLLSITNRSSAFSIGLLNGILPCGLVYIALAGALIGGQLLGGALYMFLFGLGTIPLMFGVMLIGKLQRSYFYRFRKLIPFALILFGGFLIYRGMMLDIPTELHLWESDNFEINCH